MFCKNCGNEVGENAAVCVKCGVAVDGGPGAAGPAKSRTTYILLGLFLGVFGVHNFYAGYTGRAIAQLLMTLLSLFLLSPIVAIWIIVEICTVTEDRQGAPFA